MSINFNLKNRITLVCANRVKLSVLFLLSTVVVPLVQAEDEWLKSTILKGVWVDSKGTIHGEVVVGFFPGDCKSKYFAIPKDQEESDKMFEILLAAIKTEKKIRLQLKECKPGEEEAIVSGVYLSYR